ncbi:hypothetical protein GCM10023147_16120 [Tsukamurella soli]|uniref:DUF1688 domain-containing protein n=1 Tax=Tsukamurella soli TaxID=644556 RepID=A0ABP8JEE7_9ACTN
MTRTRPSAESPASAVRRPDTSTAVGAATALASTAAVRCRAQALLERARGGASGWFLVDDGALGSAAQIVADVTRTRYPGLAIPYHSRWRHFEAGGVDRTAALGDRLAQSGADTGAIARAQIDLAVVSVLLDAGAGPDWRFAEDGRRIARSEGLAVASWHAFTAGLFSSDPGQPLRADAAALRTLDAGRLAAAFQVGPANPLVGLDGRLALLHRLRDAVAARR